MAFDSVPIDQVRRYWDARPCNIRHSPAPIGSRQYFDEVTARKYFVEPHIPVLADFQKWRGKRVLEVGCGIGTDTIRFAQNGARVTAIDLSEQSLQLARQRAEVYGLSGQIQLYQANAERLSDFIAPLDGFDLIYSFGVLHHTPHPEAAFRELRRYMRFDSELRIMVYHQRSAKVARILANAYLRGNWKTPARLIADESEAQFGSPVTYTYTRASITKLLQETGFHVENVWADHIFPYRIPDYVQYRYVRQWWATMPPPLFRVLERLAGWHLCVVATK